MRPGGTVQGLGYNRAMNAGRLARGAACAAAVLLVACSYSWKTAPQPTGSSSDAGDDDDDFCDWDGAFGDDSSEFSDEGGVDATLE